MIIRRASSKNAALPSAAASCRLSSARSVKSRGDSSSSLIRVDVRVGFFLRQRVQGNGGILISQLFLLSAVLLTLCVSGSCHSCLS